jgi:hypothetical protein
MISWKEHGGNRLRYSAGGAVLLSAVTGPSGSRPNFVAPIYAAGVDSAKPPEDGAPPLFIKANIPVELHIFQNGRHGFTQKGGGANHYLDRLERVAQGQRLALEAHDVMLILRSRRSLMPRRRQ